MDFILVVVGPLREVITVSCHSHPRETEQCALEEGLCLWAHVCVYTSQAGEAGQATAARTWRLLGFEPSELATQTEKLAVAHLSLGGGQLSYGDLRSGGVAWLHLKF